MSRERDRVTPSSAGTKNGLDREVWSARGTRLAPSPVAVPKPSGEPLKTLARLSKRLAASGVEAGADDYAQLNALAAHRCGLSRDDFAYVVATFPLLPEALRSACVRVYQHATKPRSLRITRLRASVSPWCIRYWAGPCSQGFNRA